MHPNIINFINSNRENLNLIIDMIPLPIFIKSEEGYYIDCNTACSKLFSIQREDIIGKTVYDLWEKEQADVFFQKDNKLLKEGGVQVYESQVTTPQKKTYDIQFHKQTFADQEGNIKGFLAIVFDITENKRLEKALLDLATTDELTGLSNRRDGLAKLEKIHNISERNSRPYCLAMIDIDHFKKINDTYGHSCGDFVLKSFATLMQKELRGSDECFRYGGEEFIVILPETELNQGLVVIERLRELWADKSLEWEKEKLFSTISIGLVQFSPGMSVDQLISCSDSTMYKAKNNGRNKTITLHANDCPICS